MFLQLANAARKADMLLPIEETHSRYPPGSYSIAVAMMTKVDDVLHTVKRGDQAFPFASVLIRFAGGNPRKDSAEYTNTSMSKAIRQMPLCEPPRS